MGAETIRRSTEKQSPDVATKREDRKKTQQSKCAEEMAEVKYQYLSYQLHSRG